MAEVVAILDGIFATRPQAEWVELIGTGGFPIATVQDYSQLADDVQLIANDYVVPYPHPSGRPYRVVAPGVQLSRTPGTVRTAAPEFGQHTEEILLEHGHDWEEIARLGEAGVIGLR